MSSEFLASSWKHFRGRGILNHIPCTRGVEMYSGKYMYILHIAATLA